MNLLFSLNLKVFVNAKGLKVMQLMKYILTLSVILRVKVMPHHLFLGNGNNA